MKLNFFYGKQPGIKNFNPRDFSERAYDCHALFQNKRGMPVAVSRHKENDIWKCRTASPLCSSVRRRRRSLTAEAASSMRTDGRCEP